MSIHQCENSHIEPPIKVIPSFRHRSRQLAAPGPCHCWQSRRCDDNTAQSKVSDPRTLGSQTTIMPGCSRRPFPCSPFSPRTTSGLRGVSKLGDAWLAESQTTGPCDSGAWIRVSESGMQSRHDPDRATELQRWDEDARGCECFREQGR